MSVITEVEIETIRREEAQKNGERERETATAARRFASRISMAEYNDRG